MAELLQIFSGTFYIGKSLLPYLKIDVLGFGEKDPLKCKLFRIFYMEDQLRVEWRQKMVSCHWRCWPQKYNLLQAIGLHEVLKNNDDVLLCEGL
jgi:hypothetical protein